MAKRKKTTRKSSPRKLSLLSLKDRKKKKSKQSRKGYLVMLKVLGIVAAVSGILVGLVYLNQYVTTRNTLEPKLVNPPVWVNQALKEKIYSAAQMGTKDFRTSQEIAASVQQSIEQYFFWFDDVKVQATDNELLISGNWRKPLVLAETNRRRFYVDANSIVLDFVEMDTLPIVRITGLSPGTAPEAGNTWKKEDLAAAIDIISHLDEMDSLVCPEKPLLFEIENIDVSNFQGRYNRSGRHILFFAKDGTKIIWGAQYGNWAEYLEVPDNQKIGRLYNFYTQHGTLQGVARYINLCDPSQYVPQPTDGL